MNTELPFFQEHSNGWIDNVIAYPSRFSALIQEIFDVFWIVALTDDMPTVRSYWQKFVGEQELASSDRGWLDVFHPMDRWQGEEAFSQAITTRQTRELTCRLRLNDSSSQPVHLHFIPVCEAPGGVSEILVCGTKLNKQKQTEEMSEAQVQLALKTSKVGTWEWNLITNELVWTDQKRVLFGFSPGIPVTYERFLQALHPDDRERAHRSNMQALAKKQEYEKDYRTIWPDGSVHWLTDRARVICDEAGKPIRVVGATLDITELKHKEEQLQEAKDQVTTILESITDAFLSIDMHWRYCYVNQRMEAYLGKKQEELLGKSIWEVVPALIGTTFEDHYRTAMKTGQVVHFEAFHPAFQRWVETSVYPNADGLSVYFHDISERKEAERQKDIFLGITGHELRTPLAALRGTLQLIERRFKRFLKKTEQITPEMTSFFESSQKYLADGIRQVDIQTRLINDLLDVSRITTGTLKLSLQCCDLTSIVRETIEDLRLVAPGRQLLLVLPETQPVKVLVDSNRISQVVMNYVTNALRYSSSDQPVHIGLRVQDHAAHVWVRDWGPGLSKEAKEKVWCCFHQVKEVPAQSGSEKGLGLGLYICQTLIEQHHGEVDVESTPGKGSTFWFRLPLAQEEIA